MLYSDALIIHFLPTVSLYFTLLLATLIIMSALYKSMPYSITYTTAITLTSITVCSQSKTLPCFISHRCSGEVEIISVPPSIILSQNTCTALHCAVRNKTLNICDSCYGIISEWSLDCIRIYSCTTCISSQEFLQEYSPYTCANIHSYGIDQ